MSMIEEINATRALANKLEAIGWYRIKAPTFSLIGWGSWMQEHGTGKWENLWPSLMFEKEEDAIMFALRWS